MLLHRNSIDPRFLLINNSAIPNCAEAVTELLESENIQLARQVPEQFNQSLSPASSNDSVALIGIMRGMEHNISKTP